MPFRSTARLPSPLARHTALQAFPSGCAARSLCSAVAKFLPSSLLGSGTGITVHSEGLQGKTLLDGSDIQSSSLPVFEDHNQTLHYEGWQQFSVTCRD